MAFFDKESIDLDHYVTTKALDGLFYMLGEEEKKIRTDPVARVDVAPIFSTLKVMIESVNIHLLLVLSYWIFKSFSVTSTLFPAVCACVRWSLSRVMLLRGSVHAVNT